MPLPVTGTRLPDRDPRDVLNFRKDRRLAVAESFNAAPGRSAVSSYRVSPTGTLAVKSGSVRNRQTDMCWIVVSKDGHHVFTANFGSGTISRYRVTPTGRLPLIEGRAAFPGATNQLLTSPSVRVAATSTACPTPQRSGEQQCPSPC